MTASKAAKAKRKSTGPRRTNSLYLITQHVSLLYGQYVTSAVVSAENEKAAVDRLIEECVERSQFTLSLVIQRERLRVRLLAEKSIGRPVLLMETGADYTKISSRSDVDTYVAE